MSYSSFYIRRAMKCSFCNIIGHLQYRNCIFVYHHISNTLNQTYLISSISYLWYFSKRFIIIKNQIGTNCEMHIWKIPFDNADWCWSNWKAGKCKYLVSCKKKQGSDKGCQKPKTASICLQKAIKPRELCEREK